jgi:Skp family chaperone for outer membrane proteins
VHRKSFDEKQDRDRDLRGTKKVLTGQINLREDHHLTKQLTKTQIRKNERRQSKKNNGRQKRHQPRSAEEKSQILKRLKTKGKNIFLLRPSNIDIIMEITTLPPSFNY